MRFIALLLLLPLAAPALAQDGAALFTEKNCHVCHSIGVDPPDKLGPHLNGVIGRTIGSLKDYAYHPRSTLPGRLDRSGPRKCCCNI